MVEQTYTLPEAIAELKRRECSEHGHSFDHITDGFGELLQVVCGRCGRSWGIVKS